MEYRKIMTARDEPREKRTYNKTEPKKYRPWLSTLLDGFSPKEKQEILRTIMKQHYYGTAT